MSSKQLLIKKMEQESRSWGITAVPTFVFDRKAVVQGAEAPEVLATEIKRVLAATEK